MDFASVNAGIVAYLSEGTKASMAREEDPLFTGAQGLLRVVIGLVRESLSIPVHWNTTSPVIGSAIMKREMKRRHAELDEAALEALARNFASAWALTRPMVHS